MEREYFYTIIMQIVGTINRGHGHKSLIELPTRLIDEDPKHVAQNILQSCVLLYNSLKKPDYSTIVIPPDKFNQYLDPIFDQMLIDDPNYNDTLLNKLFDVHKEEELDVPDEYLEDPNAENEQNAARTQQKADADKSAQERQDLWKQEIEDLQKQLANAKLPIPKDATQEEIDAHEQAKKDIADKIDAARTQQKADADKSAQERQDLWKQEIEDLQKQLANAKLPIPKDATQEEIDAHEQAKKDIADKIDAARTQQTSAAITIQHFAKNIIFRNKLQKKRGLERDKSFLIEVNESLQDDMTTYLTKIQQLESELNSLSKAHFDEYELDLKRFKEEESKIPKTLPETLKKEGIKVIDDLKNDIQFFNATNYSIQEEFTILLFQEQLLEEKIEQHSRRMRKGV